MPFEIDKQTLEELNLLGKFRQGSVYHLFNLTRTRGGEQLLDRMFRELLSDEAAINKRSSIFQFFRKVNIAFPFDVKKVAQMREYLDSGAPKNTVVALAGIVLKKCLSAVTRDERYRKIVQGLQATIITLGKCRLLVNTLEAAASPYAGRLKAIREVLDDKSVHQLYNIDIYQSIPLKTLAYYDHLLKNRLHKEIADILSFIYETDVYIAVNEVASARGFGYATALPAVMNVLEAAELSHPCLEKAVGNNLSMLSESNVLFLTGANMAGKSTLMKAIGINLYLAHMGFPVAADSMKFSIREGIYSSINVADNIGLGYSHFYAEVVRVKQAAIAAAGGKRLLLMFDELFKGTNVKDAYDGTLAVTEGFSDYRQCLFVVSTHIIEVGEALRDLANIQFVYMPTIMDGIRPHYTYRLQQGITEDRQGMLIIKNEGILELLHSSKTTRA
ncbi:MutS-related protein [Niabella beijingensis]|uniref:MutS-related protein n=1 Tax=Niabella beijingensis TaxID=2872700 RepID=UPI001CBEEFEC|nr:DNA mismatch repair protein [Niabella beijingensis]MBZ4189386.1 DNA mismatch repair protein [Niabella beijingensis]